MAKDEMIPRNGILMECFGKDNLSLVVVEITDKLVLSKGLDGVHALLG